MVPFSTSVHGLREAVYLDLGFSCRCYCFYGTQLYTSSRKFFRVFHNNISTLAAEKPFGSPADKSHNSHPTDEHQPPVMPPINKYFLVIPFPLSVRAFLTRKNLLTLGFQHLMHHSLCLSHQQPPQHLFPWQGCRSTNLGHF